MHRIYHTPQMEEMRGRGRLRPTGFVRLRKLFERGRRRLRIPGAAVWRMIKGSSANRRSSLRKFGSEAWNDIVHAIVDVKAPTKLEDQFKPTTTPFRNRLPDCSWVGCHH